MQTAKKLLFICCWFLFSVTASHAKPITLYDQPAVNAKSVGVIDSESGVIIIFKPKAGEWTKVADPSNGNVGWIKSNDIGNVNFNYRVITGGNGNHQYQIYQYGNMPPQTRGQIENEIKAMELRQQVIQRNMQHMMSDMQSMFNYPMPMMIPILVIPESVAIPKTQTKKVDVIKEKKNNKQQ